MAPLHGSGARTSRARGASGVEYVIALLLIAVTAIIGWKALGRAYKCRQQQVTVVFGNLIGGSAELPSCEDENGSGDPVASNSPPGGDDGCPNGLCMLPDSCFVAGTPVMTESGLRPIEAVVAGMRVLSRGEEGGAPEWKPVTRTFVRSTDGLVRLTIADAAGGEESLQLTPDHRVQVEGRGWVAADQLLPGRDRLVDAEREPLALQAVESLAEPALVYNFEVAEDHTYFVGEHAVWVHNNCKKGKGGGGGSGGGPPKKGDHIFNNGYSMQFFGSTSQSLFNGGSDDQKKNCATTYLASALQNIQNNLNQAESNCQVTVDKSGPKSSDGDENSQKYGAAKRDFTDALSALTAARIAYDKDPGNLAKQQAFNAADADAIAKAQTLRSEAFDQSAYDQATNGNSKEAKDNQAKLDACKQALDGANAQLQQALKDYGNAAAGDNNCR